MPRTLVRRAFVGAVPGLFAALDRSRVNWVSAAIEFDQLDER